MECVNVGWAALPVFLRSHAHVASGSYQLAVVAGPFDPALLQEEGALHEIVQRECNADFKKKKKNEPGRQQLQYVAWADSVHLDAQP
jgi:hypothetical protein